MCNRPEKLGLGCFTVAIDGVRSHSRGVMQGGHAGVHTAGGSHSRGPIQQWGHTAGGSHSSGVTQQGGAHSRGGHVQLGAQTHLGTQVAKAFKPSGKDTDRKETGCDHLFM